LYTQCVKCETVFRLSAEVLRAAGGQVRCGRCGEVFNALARLAEDPSTFPAGESPLEMETRANEILESAVPPPLKSGESSDSDQDTIEIEDLDSNDIDFARLQLVEKFVEDLPPPNSAIPSVEMKAPPAGPAVPPASLPASGPASLPAASRAASLAPKPPSAPAPRKPPAPAPVAAPSPPTVPQDTEDLLDDGSMEFTLPPGELDRVFVDRSMRSRQAFPGAGSSPAAAGKHADADADANDIVEGDGAAERSHVSDDARREMLSGISEPALAEISEPPHRPLPFKLWLGAAFLLALLLCAQLAHGNREWLATHAPGRGPLHGLYAALGIAVAGPANLSAYQLRQWGVTGDPSASGTLRVRASILNTAAQLQPYPLLRVTLANRFGAKIGARDFEPAEYMGKPIVKMLAPGERADATLDIVDPGKDAEGFEIDVCIRGIEQKISCAGDAATQAKQ
jgi:predicted Zn finger-like uncharacterized protein